MQPGVRTLISVAGTKSPRYSHGNECVAGVPPPYSFDFDPRLLSVCKLSGVCGIKATYFLHSIVRYNYYLHDIKSI